MELVLPSTMSKFLDRQITIDEKRFSPYQLTRSAMTTAQRPGPRRVRLRHCHLVAPVGRVLALVALSQVWRLSASQPAFLRGRGGS